MVDFASPDGSAWLKATCYYPHPMRAFPAREGNTPLDISFMTDRNGFGNWDRLGGATFFVSPRDYRLSKIEASARLDIADIVGHPETWGISRHGGRWYLYPTAPFGIGKRGNPLVPGRDFAHTPHGTTWPFGTRITLQDIPDKLARRIQRQLYLADSFGSKEVENRIDLFVEDPCDFYGSIKTQSIDFPWLGTAASPISTDPVTGCQQALQILGYPLPRWGADGFYGEETRSALRQWAAENEIEVQSPGQISPTDPEIAYKIREAARPE